MSCDWWDLDCKAREAASWVDSNIIAPLSGGDIAKAVGSGLSSVINVVKTPVDVAGALVKGDTQSAGRFISRGVGSAVNALNPGQTQFVTSNSKYFTNKDVDRATLGYSSDFAGSMSAVNSSRTTGDVSSSDLNSVGRYISKTAAIGGSALAYGKYAAMSAADKAALGSQITGAGSVAAAAKKGDVVGVANALVPGIGDTFNSYLPQLPSMNPDLTSLYNDLFNSSGNAGAPGNLSSYTGGQASNALQPATNASNVNLALISVAGIAAIYFFVLRKH